MIEQAFNNFYALPRSVLSSLSRGHLCCACFLDMHLAKARRLSQQTGYKFQMGWAKPRPKNTNGLRIRRPGYRNSNTVKCTILACTLFSQFSSVLQKKKRKRGYLSQVWGRHRHPRIPLATPQTFVGRSVA